MLLDNQNGKLTLISEDDFTKEKELQLLCEENLELMLNLEFVATEFTVSNFRLDTVAYDKESNSFVIIEYKNKRNSSVIDKGYSYLSVMLNHKADFVLEYSKKFNKVYSVSDIDWGQSKVIFISPNFTSYQINSINFKDLPIELWKIKTYDNNTIAFNQVKAIDVTATIEEIAPFKESKSKAIINTIVRNYNETDLLAVGVLDIKDLYCIVKDMILEIDEDITLKANKLYMSFVKNRKTVICVKVQKNSLVIWLNTRFENIFDPQNIVKDVTNIGHHGVGNCEIKLSDDSNIGYVNDLLKKYLIEAHV